MRPCVISVKAIHVGGGQVSSCLATTTNHSGRGIKEVILQDVGRQIDRWITRTCLEEGDALTLVVEVQQ